MNKIIFLLLLSLLCITEQIVAENPKNKKSTPVHQHIEQKLSTNQKKSNNKPKSSVITKKSDNQQKSNSQVENLIQEFVKSAKNIKGDCKSKPKSDKSDKKEDRTEHFKSVNLAYEAYKKLHEHMKKNPNMTITKEQDETVKKSAIKLFECKNVQNMAWKPHVQGQSKK